MKNIPDYIHELNQRRAFFHQNFPETASVRNESNSDELLKNSCPVCGYMTLEERSSWEICVICFWEDDGQDDYNADKVLGGPNGNASLTDERILFFGAKQKLMLTVLRHDDFKCILQDKFRLLDTLIDDKDVSQKSLILKMQAEIITILQKNKVLGRSSMFRD